MFKSHYENGARAALAFFKLSNLAQGAQAYNPSLNGQATGAAQNAALKPPSPVSSPIAAGAAKSQVLG